MKDIRNYIHKFKIESMEIELTINFINQKWSCKITKGETGMSSASGGVYHSLNDYIKEQEREHRYAYNFFNHGYAAAKSLDHA